MSGGALHYDDFPSCPSQRSQLCLWDHLHSMSSGLCQLLRIPALITRVIWGAFYFNLSLVSSEGSFPRPSSRQGEHKMHCWFKKAQAVSAHLGTACPAIQASGGRGNEHKTIVFQKSLTLTLQRVCDDWTSIVAQITTASTKTPGLTFKPIYFICPSTSMAAVRFDRFQGQKQRAGTSWKQE